MSLDQPIPPFSSRSEVSVGPSKDTVDPDALGATLARFWAGSYGNVSSFSAMVWGQFPASQQEASPCLQLYIFTYNNCGSH